MEIMESVKTHELKIESLYFNDVIKGNKTFELRKNDRAFKVGDCFILNEIENGEYTGRTYKNRISFMFEDTERIYGLDKGYCIFCWKDKGLVGVRVI